MNNIFTKKFSLKDRAKLSKKAHFLLSAGVPFLETLSIIHNKELKVWKKDALSKTIESIKSGKSIYKSFLSFSIFDYQSLHIIQVSENSGTLSKGFEVLSRELNEKIEDRNRLIGILAYPVCIMLFSFVLVIILLVVVFPKILPLIASSGAEIPFSTNLVISSYDFIKDFGLEVLFLSVMLSFSIFLAWKKLSQVRMMFWKSFIKVPGLGFLFRLSKNSIQSRHISILIESGHTLVEALSYSLEYEENILYKEAIFYVVSGVKKGKRFSSLLSDRKDVFEEEMIQFSLVGEESGSLARSLREASGYFKEEIKDIGKKLFSLLEPTMMVFIGGIVGFLALSLISPIYSLTSSVNRTMP